MKNSITDVPQIDRTKALLENIHVAAEMYIVAIRKASTKTLGAEKMAKMKKLAEAQFLNSHTTGRLSNEEWAEFSGVKQ